MEVVKRGHQFGLLRKQHTVAENIAAHITNTYGGERFGLNVFTQLAEVVFNTFPRAAGSNAHFLMVVTVAAAAGEGITQPKTCYRLVMVTAFAPIHGFL